jgi:hypothetical protein
VTETTTIRISVDTKKRLDAHRDGGMSIGDVVTRLANAMPTNTEITRARDRLAAYLRTHLVRDFGDQDEAAPGEELWQELAQLQHPDNPDSAAPTGVILDHTALSLLANGRRLLAQLVYTQPSHHQRRLFAPTQVVYTATVQHNGLARHLDRLGVITPCTFDLDAALTVGEKVPTNATPAVAHVVHEARPNMEWPTGRPVLTVVPPMYQPYRLSLRTLPEHD